MKTREQAKDLGKRIKEDVSRQYKDTRFSLRTWTEVSRTGIDDFISLSWTDGPDIEAVRRVVTGVIGFTQATRIYSRKISDDQLARYRAAGVNLYSTRVLDSKGYRG